MLVLYFGTVILVSSYVGRPIPQLRIEFVRVFYWMIHIGELIKEELFRQQRTVSWFARNLYCERTNVYSIFKRKSLDTDLLFRISKLLQHNFFQHYSEELGVENNSTNVYKSIPQQGSDSVDYSS